MDIHGWLQSKTNHQKAILMSRDGLWYLKQLGKWIFWTDFKVFFGGHSWCKFTFGYDCTDVAMKNMLMNCVTKISTGHQPCWPFWLLTSVMSRYFITRYYTQCTVKLRFSFFMPKKQSGISDFYFDWYFLGHLRQFHRAMWSSVIPKKVLNSIPKYALSKKFVIWLTFSFQN